MEKEKGPTHMDVVVTRGVIYEGKPRAVGEKIAQMPIAAVRLCSTKVAPVGSAPAKAAEAAAKALAAEEKAAAS